MRFLFCKANGNWRGWRAFVEGFRDGFEQVELSCGITWENDSDANEAYDSGANWGERLARLIRKAVPA